METDISVKVLTTEVQKAQLEDPAIRPILEKKLNSEDRPSWQEITPESPATKRYWALWDSLHLKNGVLYRKWESDDGSFCRWQLTGLFWYPRLGWETSLFPHVNNGKSDVSFET
ncbi:hypothetical protein AVEN_203021-1 [Araneus ventricosus]|uniref:Uncharacterized protein n=1 Tax=Araneus ventricosus TaxID=182803 RepID=A0A4Y2EMN0_ARAVE|nr:hypothetical protein AVEN_203021-1 [Araneus ventricosus]